MAPRNVQYLALPGFEYAGLWVQENAGQRRADERVRAECAVAGDRRPTDPAFVGGYQEFRVDGGTRDMIAAGGTAQRRMDGPDRVAARRGGRVRDDDGCPY